MWQKSKKGNATNHAEPNQARISKLNIAWQREIFILINLCCCNKRIGNKMFAHDAMQTETISSTGN